LWKILEQLIGKKDIILWRASQANIFVDTILITIEMLNHAGYFTMMRLKR